MKFEKTETWGFAHAIRGMRNPFESWVLSDSAFCTGKGCLQCVYEKSKCDSLDWYEDYFAIGEKDLILMKKLISAGSEHRKFMRQIFVSVDISAPLYWWKEFDTYKIGTVADSTSTMHKLTSKSIIKSCFELGGVIPDSYIEHLEHLRQLATDKTRPKDFRNEAWKKLIVNLPESWLQTRTVTMNYENVLNMVKQRKNHKLTEWSVDFIEWAKTLPYAEELLFMQEEK